VSGSTYYVLPSPGEKSKVVVSVLLNCLAQSLRHKDLSNCHLARAVSTYEGALRKDLRRAKICIQVNASTPKPPFGERASSTPRRHEKKSHGQVAEQRRKDQMRVVWEVT
jgi:hypothetical protein